MTLPLISKNLVFRQRSTVLVLVAAILSSLAFSIFSSTASQVSLTSSQALGQYWRTTYDILVRAPEHVSEIEKEYGLVRANHLSGAPGGITFEQWEQIKAVPGVEVAAPIAMLGYIPRSPTVVGIQDLRQPGIYRVSAEMSLRDGDRLLTYEQPLAPYYGWYNGETHVLSGWDPESYKQMIEQFVRLEMAFGMGDPDWHGLTVGTPVFNDQALIAAIDPEQEARLVHLDEMVVQGDYLKNDRPFLFPEGHPNEPLIPVLMNLHDYIQETVHIKVEYVDILPRKGPQLEAFLAIPDRAALEAAPHELVWEQTLSLPREWANNSPVLGVKNGQIKPDWKGLSPDEGGRSPRPPPFSTG